MRLRMGRVLKSVWRAMVVCRKGRIIFGGMLILLGLSISSLVYMLWKVVKDEKFPEIDQDHSLDEEMYQSERIEAESLAKKVRVLCMIITGPKYHKTRAIHVKTTWGRRCNKLVFMSSERDTKLDSIAIPMVQEGWKNLWAKTRESFRFVYQNYFEEADWFMKADDDTFVVLENLRFLLKDHNSSHPIYFGSKLSEFVRQGYMSGGAGYILSKEALRRFVEVALELNTTMCQKDWGEFEDVEMGKCLENVGVEAGDSRDSLGRHRFLPYSPQSHLIPFNTHSYYYNFRYYPQGDGLDCCADDVISFHEVKPKHMYELEYFIYHMRVHGINRDPHRVYPMKETTPK